jgi:hypothetical protein
MGLGEVTALFSLGFCRWFLYIIFTFLLGAICTREALRSDFLIAQKVGESILFCPQRAPFARVIYLFPLTNGHLLLQSCLGVCIDFSSGLKFMEGPEISKRYSFCIWASKCVTVLRKAHNCR